MRQAAKQAEMQSVSGEIAEQVWEETHAQALLFAQKLASTRFELSLPKEGNSLSTYSSKPGTAGSRSRSGSPTTLGVEQQADYQTALSLSDFYANDREMSAPAHTPGGTSTGGGGGGGGAVGDSRATSPALASARPFSSSQQQQQRPDLRVQTPKAADFMGLQEPLDLGELSQRSLDSVDSMTSLLTTSSYGSYGSVSVSQSLGSAASLLPFPFREPPRLPHVDTFQRRGLRYADIKRGAVKARRVQGNGQGHGRGRGRRRGRDGEGREGEGGFELGDDFSDAASSVLPRSLSPSVALSQAQPQARESSPSADNNNTTNSNNNSNNNSNSGEDERVTVDQLEAVMDYFKSFSRADPLIPGAYEVSLADFDAALRKFSRALVTAEDEKLGRSLLVSLDWLLRETGLSTKQWFALADSRNKKTQGDGKLTLRELEASIDGLCDKVGLPHWRRRDVHFMLRQMDPNGDGDLTAAEIAAAFAQLKKPPATASAIERAGPVIRRIHEYLRAKGIKVKDVFAAADKDGSETISADELRQALRGIFVLPAAPAAAAPDPAAASSSAAASAARASPAASVSSRTATRDDFDGEEGWGPDGGAGTGTWSGTGAGTNTTSSSSIGTSEGHGASKAAGGGGGDGGSSSSKSKARSSASLSPLLRALQVRSFGKGRDPSLEHGHKQQHGHKHGHKHQHQHQHEIAAQGSYYRNKVQGIGPASRRGGVLDPETQQQSHQRLLASMSADIQKTVAHYDKIVSGQIALLFPQGLPQSPSAPSPPPPLFRAAR